MVSSVRGEHPLISSLSTHHTHDYTDGVIRNSTKNTSTSWKKPGNAGRAHAKRLTQRRTAAEPSLHTYPLSQELPAYGESTTHCTPCKGVKNRCTLGNDSRPATIRSVRYRDCIWVITLDPFLENGLNPAWVRCDWSGYSDPSGDRNHLRALVTTGHGELAYE
jgi:hypothetical protein